MGVWESMKWVAKEGTGAGVHKRFGQMILGRTWQRAAKDDGILRQFLGSAAAAVTRFGPIWARREVRGRSVGVWLLVMCWLVPPALLFLATIRRNGEHQQIPSHRIGK